MAMIRIRCRRTQRWRRLLLPEALLLGITGSRCAGSSLSCASRDRHGARTPGWADVTKASTEADQRLLSGNLHAEMIGTVECPAERVLLCEQGLVCSANVSF